MVAINVQLTGTNSFTWSVLGAAQITLHTAVSMLGSQSLDIAKNDSQLFFPFTTKKRRL
jgi:hypothetical protein